MSPARLLAATLTLLVATPSATAGWLLCPDPVTYLIICCPKPCPVVDGAKNSILAAKAAIERAQVQTTTAHNLEVQETHRTLGHPGLRATTHDAQCPPVEGPPAPGTTPTVFKGDPIDPARVTGPIPPPEGRHTAQERLIHNATADAWRALQLLRAWADAADESLAKSVLAVPHANDTRELVRRAQEIQRANTRLDHLHTITVTARERLRAARATRALIRTQ